MGAGPESPDVPDPTGDEPAFEALKRKIHLERGFNTHFYKDKCLRRRVAVRMRARGLTSLGDYAALLDEDEAEYDRLLDVLTVNVSKFFRNLDMWRALEQRVLPDLFGGSERRHEIWSAGCAGGEEAYTLAILLHEYAAAHGRPEALERFRIVGSDIDAGSLKAARAGVYPELALAETPEDIRQRWFSGGPAYRLSSAAARSVAFERRDLLSDPHREGQSLILCRNVIIYFDRGVQDELFQRFHASLLPGGYLVLGKVETLLGPARGLFEVVQSRERIFRKRG